MSPLSGVSTFFISVWIIKAMTQNAPDSIDVVMTDCRITGIALFTGKKPNSFDFIEAQEVCKQTGLVLARKSQIENALKHGFETCRARSNDSVSLTGKFSFDERHLPSTIQFWKGGIGSKCVWVAVSFGWVAEGFIVISRKTSNIKCGQGKTGVAQWIVSHNRKSNAYCYNSSDTWINSCIPEASTTSLPDASTEMNTTSTDSFQDTSAITRTSEAKPTQRFHPLFRIICITETILPTETIKYEEEITLPPNQAAFKNDDVVFGGIPTALLVLALIFFVAAVVLAVCYIKKYKKTFPFSEKEEKREVIETQDIKETKPSSKTPEQESRKNGKKAEETQAKPEPSVKCMEAEV